jgi:L-ascorbate metabolism protein UlaG (beta-lactamase superfamily)
MKITYHGHSCVLLESAQGALIIDPFLKGNPVARVKPEDIKVNHVLLTHGHGDHLGDAVEISKNNNAPVCSIVELATYVGSKGAQTIGFNMGGTVRLGYADVKLTHAFHSSSFTEEDGRIIYLGMPAGFIIRMDGRTLYHAGDTSLFGDLKMLGELYDIDVAFLPMGDHYTMGPDDGAIAAEWLRAKQVVPIHYNTFPPIRQDENEIQRKLAARGVEGVILKPGDSLEL